MTTRLRLRQHSVTEGPMIEVWDDHQFVAGIDVTDRGVKVTSKYPIDISIGFKDELLDVDEVDLKFGDIPC